MYIIIILLILIYIIYSSVYKSKSVFLLVTRYCFLCFIQGICTYNIQYTRNRLKVKESVRIVNIKQILIIILGYIKYYNAIHCLDLQIVPLDFIVVPIVRWIIYQVLLAIAYVVKAIAIRGKKKKPVYQYVGLLAVVGSSCSIIIIQIINSHYTILLYY